MVSVAQAKYGNVAQLVRADGSYPSGQWFESTHCYSKATSFRSPFFYLFSLRAVAVCRCGKLRTSPRLNTFCPQIGDRRVLSSWAHIDVDGFRHGLFCVTRSPGAIHRDRLRTWPPAHGLLHKRRRSRIPRHPGTRLLSHALHTRERQRLPPSPRRCPPPLRRPLHHR